MNKNRIIAKVYDKFVKDLSERNPLVESLKCAKVFADAHLMINRKMKGSFYCFIKMENTIKPIGSSIDIDDELTYEEAIEIAAELTGMTERQRDSLCLYEAFSIPFGSIPKGEVPMREIKGDYVIIPTFGASPDEVSKKCNCPPENFSWNGLGCVCGGS